PDADAHVADAGSRHATDQDGNGSRWQDRAADMRHDAGYHRADVHVGDARSRLAHQSVSASMRPAPPLAMSRADTRKRFSRASRLTAWPRTAARATEPATARPGK